MPPCTPAEAEAQSRAALPRAEALAPVTESSVPKLASATGPQRELARDQMCPDFLIKISTPKVPMSFSKKKCP